MLHRPDRRTQVRAFVRQLLLIDLAIFGGVGIICLVGGWHTWTDYGNGLVLAVAALITVALFSALGGWQSTSGFRYQYAATAGPDDAHARAQQAMQDRNGGLGFVLYMLLVAILPVAVAFLLGVSIDLGY